MTTIPLPASPSKPVERRPLGETGGNAPTQSDAEQHDVATDALSEVSSPEVTSFTVEDLENSQPHAAMATKSGKKSKRKGKADTARSIRKQFGQQMDEWSHSTRSKSPSPVKLEKMSSGTKSQRRKKNVKGTARSKPEPSSDCIVLEDEHSAPVSPASEEAVELLKVDNHGE